MAESANAEAWRGRYTPNLLRSIPESVAKTSVPMANGRKLTPDRKTLVACAAWKYTGRKYEIACTKTEERKVKKNAAADVRLLNNRAGTLESDRWVSIVSFETPRETGVIGLPT